MKRKFVTYTLALCLVLMMGVPTQAFAVSNCARTGKVLADTANYTQLIKNCNISYNNCNSLVKAINANNYSKYNTIISNNSSSKNCATNLNCYLNLANCRNKDNCNIKLINGTITYKNCPSNQNCGIYDKNCNAPNGNNNNTNNSGSNNTNQGNTAPEQGTDTETTVTGLNSYEQQVVDLVNKERASAGLGSLKVNAKLSAMARVKAEDMRDNNYFSHTSPTYGSPFDMMKKFGISYTAAGENIAKGQRTPESVMSGWMNSSGHKANILNSSYDQIGVGYVTDSKGNTYWVQEFIK